MAAFDEGFMASDLGEFDVMVAGAGVAGVFAAIAAGRRGARTLLVDRFGAPGGNMGPGMIAGGSLSGWPIRHMFNGPFYGIPREFMERHGALGGGSVPPFRESHYLRDSQIASYVALKMLREAGVQLLLSTYVSDPIMDRGGVGGLYMENKSGRIAAKGKVVIDATGEADISRRAGAFVIRPEASYNDIDAHAPTGMGLYFVIGGVDWDAYEGFKLGVSGSRDEDLRWAREVIGEGTPAHLAAPMRRAWEGGQFRVRRDLGGLGELAFNREIGVVSRKEGLGGSMLNLKTPWVSAEAQARVDAGDGAMVSMLEAELRTYLFDLARFWRLHVPGFEESYLAHVAPYLGSRGGPCIEGDYVMTHRDLEAGRRFPDVLYVFDHVGGLARSAYQGQWTDFPYRVMLPRGLEGVLAAGRSASCRPDTLLRSRSMVMHMGEAAGTAAGLCVENGTTPRSLDVAKLQRAMLDSGYFLGDLSRLRELGLA